MTCFWTDLVSTTQFCDAPAVGGPFGLATFSGYDGFYTVSSVVASVATPAAAFTAVSAPPSYDVSAAYGISGTPFEARPQDSWLIASACFFAGLSEYATVPKTVNTLVGIGPSVVFDDTAGDFVLSFEDSVESASLTVTEAYIAYVQQDSTPMLGNRRIIGMAAAALDAARFTVGVPTPGVLRVDYAGGARPSTGAYTVYGSADEFNATVDAGALIASVIRVVGTVTTGASASIPVDCYITGYRNGEF